MNYKVMFLVVGAGILVAAPFIIPGPNGKPMASLETAKQILFDGLAPVTNMADTVSSSIPNMSGSKQSGSQVYKWQDSSGHWHFGDAPPQDNTSVEAIVVDTSANNIPAFKAPKVKRDVALSKKLDVLNIGENIQEKVDERDAAIRAVNQY